MIDYNPDDNSILCIVFFKVKDVINDVSLNINPPREGDSTKLNPDISVPEGANYHVNSDKPVRWMNGDADYYEEMEDKDAYSVGDRAIVSFYLYPNEGYGFTDRGQLTFTVDGSTTALASSGIGIPIYCVVGFVVQEKEAVPDQEYNLWVGGVRVTSEKLKGEGWYFDPSTTTLYLNNVNISSSPGEDIIQTCIYATLEDLTISLTGNNTVGDEYAKEGIYSYRALTISGDGSLTASGYEDGIYVNDKLTIIKASVTANGKSSDDTEESFALRALSIDLQGVETITPEDGKIGVYTSGNVEEETIVDQNDKIAKTAFIGPVTPVYAAVSGEYAVYVLNSGEDLVFTVKRNVNDGSCFERFNQSEKGVEIDDSTLIRDTDYTAAKGSTIVTLKAATMNKLSEGKHTVTVYFNDGEAKISLTVKRASSPAPVPPASYKIPITGVE